MSEGVNLKTTELALTADSSCTTMAGLDSTSSSAGCSLWLQYQQYLDLKCRETVQGVATGPMPTTHSASLSVGIVGAGMAGLYSALLLQQHVPGVNLKLFEANDRVGGRVFTHKFSTEPHQYYDTGAMRIPDVESHKPVFMLIEHLNRETPEDPVSMREFCCHSEGNRVFVNSTKKNGNYIMSAKYASKHCSELGFPPEANVTDTDSANRLLQDALAPVLEDLKKDFDWALEKYSQVSFYDYLSKHLGWNRQMINYIETMSGATNQFRRGLIDELFCLRMFDNVSSWKTIEGGMSKLPDLCARVLAKKNVPILLNSKVESITQQDDRSSVRVGYTSTSSGSKLTYESFDAIILAIPPSCIRMVPENPYWGPEKDHALRATYFEPASKMGLRFQTRFWERSDLQLPASHGGQSITDLPIRRALYPTHGVGDSGKGVLCIYNVLNDARHISLLTKVERIKLALQNLQVLYPEVNIAQEYAGGDNSSDNKFVEEAFIKDWPVGATFYHPGEYLSLYQNNVCPEGNIYFAGVHLSPHFVWIVGALDSAKRAVQQLVLKTFGTETVEYIF